MRRIALAFALVTTAVVARPAIAITPVPSFSYLVTGNGFGFQVFDISAGAIKQYLEHPYRYLRTNPANPDGEGIVRRNLAFDTYFGVQVGSTSQWLGGVAPSEIGYVNESNMIRSAVNVGPLTTESFFSAPFGYAGNALVMMLKVTNNAATAQTVTAYAIHNFKMGTATDPDNPGADGESIAWDGTHATETGPGGGTMVYVPIGGADASSCNANSYNTVAAGGQLATPSTCSGTDIKNAFQKNLGSIAPGASAWFGVAVLYTDGSAATVEAAWSTFLAGQTPDALYASILAEQEAARTTPAPGMNAPETAVWRQAETTLRMGQIMEPYAQSPRAKNTGMMLASLPPGAWHTGWVRDGTYAIDALARTGHGAQAKAALNFFLDADADQYGSFLNNVNYRVSVVRYFGDGLEEADYSGQPTRNIEIDGWGLVLWAARNYVDSTADLGWLAEMTQKGDTVYDAIKNGIAEPLAANLEANGMAIADASIWEVHWGNRQHFLYTTAAAARGFCDMATLARRAGRTDDIARYKMLAQNATNALKANFIDSKNVLAGSLERLASGSNYHDGSTVEAITFSLLDPADPIATATLGALSYLQTPAGGYKRLEGSSDQYDTDEWILIDLRASDAFRRAGNGPQGDALLDWVTGQASVNYNLLPELYNTQSASGAIGAYSGSIPMVGYGAGAFMLTMLDRVQLYEHTDCGDEDLSDYPDAGAVIPMGGDAGGGNGATGRTGLACACNGGPGSGGTAVALVVVALLVTRRRRS